MGIVVNEEEEDAEPCDASGGSWRSARGSETFQAEGTTGSEGETSGRGNIGGVLGLMLALVEGDGPMVSSTFFLPKNFDRSICLPEYSGQNFDASFGGSRLPSILGFTSSTSRSLMETPSRLGSGISSSKSR